MRCWFEHNQEAGRTTRERLVSHPRLFLQAQQERCEQEASARLRDGPEGECVADLQRIEAIIARLRKRLRLLIPLPEVLTSAGPRLQAAIDALRHDIKRYGEHDCTRDPQ